MGRLFDKGFWTSQGRIVLKTMGFVNSTKEVRDEGTSDRVETASTD